MILFNYIITLLSYRRGTSAGKDKLVLSYWMNRLQTFIPKNIDLIVTLNPLKEPKKEKTFSIIDYEHPIYLPNVSYSSTFYLSIYLSTYLSISYLPSNLVHSRSEITAKQSRSEEYVLLWSILWIWISW